MQASNLQLVEQAGKRVPTLCLRVTLPQSTESARRHAEQTALVQELLNDIQAQADQIKEQVTRRHGLDTVAAVIEPALNLGVLPPPCQLDAQRTLERDNFALANRYIDMATRFTRRVSVLHATEAAPTPQVPSITQP